MSAPERPHAPSRRLRQLLLCGIALLVLAGLSFGLSYLKLGAWALPAALAIAATKAGLVLNAFMELNGQNASVKLGAGLALLMLALLLALMLSDIATREPAPLPAPLGAAQVEAPHRERARVRRVEKLRVGSEWHASRWN